LKNEEEQEQEEQKMLYPPHFQISNSHSLLGNVGGMLIDQDIAFPPKSAHGKAKFSLFCAVIFNRFDNLREQKHIRV
jgi:hypothetical protein